MAPAKAVKPKAYKMLLNRISVDGQPVLIARHATLRLKKADGTSKAKSATQADGSGQLMEVHVDDKLLGRWDLSLLANRAADDITQEFQADDADKTLVFELPMSLDNDVQSQSFPRGIRDSSSFIKNVRLRLGSHQDFHNAISFLAKDAGLRQVEYCQDDPPFPPKRPQSQTAFSASQPTFGSYGQTVPRPQSVMLPPSRPSSQISHRLAAQKLSANQSRRHGLSLSQDYGMVPPGPEHASRLGPTFRQSPMAFPRGVQLHPRSRLVPSPGGSFVDGVSTFPRPSQSFAPPRQQTRSAGLYKIHGRPQSYDGLIHHTYEKDDPAPALRNPQQTRRQPLSWHPGEVDSTCDTDADYDVALNDESVEYPGGLLTQRRQSLLAQDTGFHTSSPEIPESDWMSATMTNSPSLINRKRAGSHQVRAQAPLKRLRQDKNTVQTLTANSHRPLMQSTEVMSRPVSAQRQSSLEISAHSQLFSKSIDETQQAPSPCMRCRRKHLPCDRMLPTCGNCASNGAFCVAPYETLDSQSAETQVSDTISGNMQKSVEASFNDSGIQIDCTTQDAASQTLTYRDNVQMIEASTNTSNDVRGVAVQTDRNKDIKLGFAEWATLVACIRTLGEQQVAKGARWLQRSSGFAREYEQRLEAAATCGADLVDTLIGLVERAMEDSN